MIDRLCASKFHDVVTWGKFLTDTDDSQWFGTFVQHTCEHDAYRNLSFEDTFEELAYAFTYHRD
jgi:hypothetical protein